MLQRVIRELAQPVVTRVFLCCGKHCARLESSWRTGIPAGCSLSSAALARFWFECEREGTSAVND